MCDETQLLRTMKTCIIGRMESMSTTRGFKSRNPKGISLCGFLLLAIVDSHLEIPRNFLFVDSCF